VAQHGMQRSRQLRTGSFQFVAVFHREFTQDGATRRREPQPHFPLIFRARTSRDRPGALEPIDQFDRTVVLNEQSRGNLPNRGPGALGQALHRQQQLMLLRLNTVLFCSCFAEVKELTDLSPELGKIAVLFEG
jgi:hypothetical protein